MKKKLWAGTLHITKAPSSVTCRPQLGTHQAPRQGYRTAVSLRTPSPSVKLWLAVLVMYGRGVAMGGREAVSAAGKRRWQIRTHVSCQALAPGNSRKSLCHRMQQRAIRIWWAWAVRQRGDRALVPSGRLLADRPTRFDMRWLLIPVALTNCDPQTSCRARPVVYTKNLRKSRGSVGPSQK